jgi:hypothetical protein
MQKAVTPKCPMNPIMDTFEENTLSPFHTLRRTRAKPIFTLSSTSTHLLSKHLEAEDGVPGVGGSLVACAKSLDLGLGILAGGDGGVVCVADVGELVANAVGDDVGVESLLLALGDERVRGDEGELGLGAAAKTGQEVHGRGAGTEVNAVDGSATAVVVVAVVLVAVVLVLVLAVVVILVLVLTVVVILVLVLAVVVVLVAAALDATSVVASIGTGIGTIVGIGVVASIVTSVVTGIGTGIGASTSIGTSTILTGENNVVAVSTDSGKGSEALSNHNLSLGEASGVEGAADRASRGSVGNIGASDGRVDERGDTPEDVVGGEGRVGADERNVDGKGVEVGLGGDKTNGSINDLLVVAELVNEGVGNAQLVARAGSGEQGAGDATGNGGSNTGRAEAGGTEGLDSIDGDLFLAESGLDDGHDGVDESELGGRHFEG